MRPVKKLFKPLEKDNYILNQTARKAVDAYGGIELWKNTRTIEADVSVKGLAFTLKRRPFFNHCRIKMEIHQPFSVLTPIGKNRSISGILDHDTVRLENEQGDIIEERKNARTFFPYGRRLFYWDDLDMAYFANYAFWNYFTLPALLMNDAVSWQEISPGLLQASFPNSIPTHCHTQYFRFDPDSGLLCQHDYTADIISGFARASHVIIQHNRLNGLQVASRRKVTPRGLFGKPMPLPVLIDIQVHDFKLL